MKQETIKAIFTNLLFVIGVILTIFGFAGAVSTASKVIFFDQYPLSSYEEQQCEMISQRPQTPDDSETSLDAETQDRQRIICEERVDHARRVRLVDDISRTIVLLISGAVLIYFFRRSMFAK